MKSDRRSQYTKKIIKDTLMDLLLDKPLGNITVKELCEKADINRGTFYRYYTDVYDLFNQLEKEMIPKGEPDILDSNDYYSSQAIGKRLHMMLSFINDNANFYKVFFNRALKSEYMEALILNTQNNLRQALIKKSISFDNTLFDYSFEYTRCGIIGLVQKWVDDDCPESPDEIAEIIINLLNKNPNPDDDNSKHI